jgi:hypothetical protein
VDFTRHLSISYLAFQNLTSFTSTPAGPRGDPVEGGDPLARVRRVDRDHAPPNLYPGVGLQLIAALADADAQVGPG